MKNSPGTVEKRPTKEVTTTEETRSGRYYVPNVDIAESREELMLFADMPGVKPNDIEVKFENGVLAIYGRVHPRQAENLNYVFQEYEVGDFYRTFRISEDIDSEKISAECSGGVLTLHLPKVEAAKPRRISVKAK